MTVSFKTSKFMNLWHNLSTYFPVINIIHFEDFGYSVQLTESHNYSDSKLKSLELDTDTNSGRMETLKKSYSTVI